MQEASFTYSIILYLRHYFLFGLFYDMLRLLFYTRIAITFNKGILIVFMLFSLISKSIFGL